MLTQQQRNNRRKRATPKQLAFLREKFLEDPKPDQATREAIGRIIDMTPRSVQIWFQNTRAKTKIQEQRLSSLYPTLSSSIGGNRSRIYFDTDALGPSRGLYGCNNYATSMPSLQVTPPLSGNIHSNLLHKPKPPFTEMDFLDVNNGGGTPLGASPMSNNSGWNEPGFFLQNDDSHISLQDTLLHADPPSQYAPSPRLDAEDLFDDIEEEVDLNGDFFLGSSLQNPHKGGLHSGLGLGIGVNKFGMGFHSTDNLTTQTLRRNMIADEEPKTKLRNQWEDLDPFDTSVSSPQHVLLTPEEEVVYNEDEKQLHPTNKQSIELVNGNYNQFGEDKDAYLVIPCHRLETFENIELFSEVVENAIELEYSPLLGKMRIYIDPTCFGSNDGILRVVEANIKEVLDYSHHHIHVRIDGTPQFYTVNSDAGELVPLGEQFNKSELLISTEYSIYGQLSILAEDDIFKCTRKVNVPSTVCASNRLSYDIKKVLDPQFERSENGQYPYERDNGQYSYERSEYCVGTV